MDRRIFYQTESCAESVVEIIPMTILEISHNYEWIIVKSGNKRRKIDFKYWIIKNKYDNLPNSETVIKNTIEFDNFEAFNTFMIDENIDLKLVKID
ncbi:MAG: hypothetical protein HRT66_04340 [Flavobacteriaceae bacterium]|nr:hypothetical protein [Flavobacteriaceae bacterium]